MATADVSRPSSSALTAAAAGADGHGAKGSAFRGDGLRPYYQSRIHDLELQIRQGTDNLSRLEAQRNVLNSQGKRRPPPPARGAVESVSWFGFNLAAFARNPSFPSRVNPPLRGS